MSQSPIDEIVGDAKLVSPPSQADSRSVGGVLKIDSVAEFLNQLEDLIKQEDEGKISRFIIVNFDSAMKCGDFAYCNQILEWTTERISTLPLSAIATFLGITWKARSQIVARDAFQEAANSLQKSGNGHG